MALTDSILGAALTVALFAVPDWHTAAGRAGPGAQQPTATARTGLDELLNDLLQSPPLDHARVGVLVHDLEGDRELLAHDAHYGFMTASNMKLVASATALCTLGPDHRFTTSLVATGPIEGGVLHGDLVLVGDGDPSLGGRDETDGPQAVFERLVEVLRRDHGISRITGDILGDDNCHPDEVMGEGWAWGYQGASYAAQISGLCFAENCATVEVLPGAPGLAPKARIFPDTEYLQIEVRARTRAAGTPRRLWLDRERGSHQVVVGGVMPADAAAVGWRGRVSVENPCAYAATVLAEVATAAGIQLDGSALDRDLRPPRPDRYGDEQVLATHRSAPLGELLMTLNKVSQNLYAEQLIRAAARSARGSGGMRVAAAHAKETLRQLGGDPRGMRIADGSGLSRLNLVKPAQLVALLRGMHDHEHATLFRRSLPIAGVDGTLGRRMTDSAAAGVVRAKTGYISSVVALSGYVPRPDDADRPLAFSILVNNFTAPAREVQRAVDSFVTGLARHVGHSE